MTYRTLAHHCHQIGCRISIVKVLSMSFSYVFCVFMLNTKVSEQMQLKSDLTLKIAVDTARQAEIQIKQTKIINDDKQVYNIRKIIQPSGHHRNHGTQQRGAPGFYGNYSFNGKDKCNYCDYKPHNRKDCPARDKYCNICKLRGHFSNVCKKKNESQFKIKNK